MTNLHMTARRDWVALMPRIGLLPHEQHDPDRARELAAEIEACGVWTMPLLVEREHRIILDGHHRWEAAKRLGFRTVPVVLIAYGDPRLWLTSWRADERWCRRDVVACALSGNLCPIKSTRHTLRPALEAIAVRLADLDRQTVRIAAGHAH